ncbi:MAG: hypothetical protein MZW92_45435 [Comamonadaceae bacterium]|nr:hypothetical protein [Comamonadaceae bacterium]
MAAGLRAGPDGGDRRRARADAGAEGQAATSAVPAPRRAAAPASRRRARHAAPAAATAPRRDEPASRPLALQHLALGAGAPGADALPDGRAAGCWASRPTSSSARTRTRRSPSARWWCRPSGPAPPRSRWPSR